MSVRQSDTKVSDNQSDTHTCKYKDNRHTYRQTHCQTYRQVDTCRQWHGLAVAQTDMWAGKRHAKQGDRETITQACSHHTCSKQKTLQALAESRQAWQADRHVGRQKDIGRRVEGWRMVLCTVRERKQS